MTALLTCLHLPALDIAHDARPPAWLDAFTPGGALAGRRPDVIICAGLGRAGKAAGIEHAAGFLRRLMRPFDAHPAHIWPVPGPGDRDAERASPMLAMAGAMPSDTLFGHAKTVDLLIEPFTAWNAARQRLVGSPLTAGAPFVAQPLTIGRLRIGFFGINSAWLDGEAPVVAAGRLGAGLDGLVGRHAPDVIIGALHHPPEAIRADEQAALTAALGRCDVVLHDGGARMDAGPPVRLGVEAGVAHWITLTADAAQIEALDPARGLQPTTRRAALPLPRTIAKQATAAPRSDGPPNMDGYLDHLTQEWGRVMLHGLIERGETDESQPVGDIYVSLRVDAPHKEARGPAVDYIGLAGRPGARPTKLDNEAIREQLRARGLPSNKAAVEAAARRLARLDDGADPRWIDAALTAFDIEQAVAAYRWLLLEGDPGTGKTTTVQAIVMALVDALAYPDKPEMTARARAMGFEPPWPVPLPIYFRQFWRWAGRHAADDRPGDALLHDYLSHRVGGYAGGDAWIRPLLDAGRALLIFDGLDEMPRDLAQAQAVRTVSDAARVFAGNRCLVTSRPAGLTGGVGATLRDAGLHGFHLRRLTPDQIDDFVGRWYGRLYGAETAALEAADLVGRIRSAGLHELAEVPITLVAMAVVHRNSRLPERRVDLYEQCIRALLHRWHDRFVDAAVKLTLCGPLGESTKVRIVERLATLAHGAGGDLAIIDRDPVLKAVHATLPPALREEHPTAGDCAPLVESLSERSGLLLRQEGGWGWRFRHRAFQEYLAARHLCQELDDQALIARLDEALSQPDWHGVVPLALAYKASSHRASARTVLAALLDRAAKREAPAACVAATAVLGRALGDLRAYELDWLDEVVDPFRRRWAGWIEDDAQPGELADRIAVAETLGAFGDPRLGWGPAQFPEVPAGLYIAGAIGRKAYRREWDRHERQVAAYRIGRFLVTVGQFLAFVDHPDFADPRWWAAGGLDDARRADAERHWRRQPPTHPVTMVSWYEAMAFCAWATAHHGGALGDGEFALPTDEAWEKAARGGAKLAADDPNPAPERDYPWPEAQAPTPDRANFDGKVGTTTPVGLYPRGAGPYDALDQAGNVWEWCDAAPEADPAWRVLRGGAWRNAPRNLRVSSRFAGHPAVRDVVIGFRCVFRGAPRSLGP